MHYQDVTAVIEGNPVNAAGGTRGEAAVSKREDRLESLIEDLPGIVWEATGRLGAGDYRVTYVSKQVESLLGYTQQQALRALQADDFAIIHPEDQENVVETADQTYRDGQARSVRFRHIAADGRPVWVQGYLSAMKDDEGRVTGLRGVNVDVTEQQRAEELLTFVIEAGRVLASSLDYEATLRNVSQLAVPTIADWCTVDLVGKDGELTEVSIAHADPARLAWAREVRASYQAPREGSPAGARLVVQTGESRLVPRVTTEMLDRAVPDKQGREIIRQLGMRSYMCVPMKRGDTVIGAITFVAAESGRRFDEPDLRAAEHLARRAAAAIDNSMAHRDAERERARFTAILTAVDYGVCQVDTEGRLEYLNPAGESLLGGHPERLGGVTFHELVHSPLPDGAPCEDADCPVTAVLSTGEACRGDNVFLTATGAYLPVQLNCSPVVVNGQLTGAVVLFDDISGRLEAERRKDDFLAFATHELRNPLTPILGLSRWLERHVNEAPGSYDQGALEAVETLRSESDRMSNIVDVFLDLSRIESNRLVVEAEPVDLRQIVEQEAAALSTRYPDVRINTRLHTNDRGVISDEGRLRQVVSNLLDNAAKYGGDPAHITLTLEVDDDTASIRIGDRGPGIPEEDQAHIFERFRRSTAATGKQGFGLGLFLTKEIVEQLGGSLSFVSRAGEGAQFTVVLPSRMPAGNDPD